MNYRHQAGRLYVKNRNPWAASGWKSGGKTGFLVAAMADGTLFKMIQLGPGRNWRALLI